MIRTNHGGHCCGINHLRKIYRQVNDGMAVEVVLTDTQLRQEINFDKVIDEHLGFLQQEGTVSVPCNVIALKANGTVDKINRSACHSMLLHWSKPGGYIITGARWSEERHDDPAVNAYWDWLVNRSWVAESIINRDYDQTKVGIVLSMDIPQEMLMSAAVMSRYPIEVPDENFREFYRMVSMGYNEDLSFALAFSFRRDGGRYRYCNGHHRVFPTPSLKKVRNFVSRTRMTLPPMHKNGTIYCTSTIWGVNGGGFWWDAVRQLKDEDVTTVSNPFSSVEHRATRGDISPEEFNEACERVKEIVSE